MFRFPLLVGILLVAAGGCGRDDDNFVDDWVHIKRTVSDKKLVIDESDTVGLTIIGDRNTITITSRTDIGIFTLTGSNNLVTFRPGSTADMFSIDGNDNTIEKLDTLTFGLYIDLGTGNVFVDI